MGGNQQFQLPNINSQSNLKGNVLDSQKLNGRNMPANNRRSQILNGAQEFQNAYGGKIDTSAYMGLNKMRTAQPSSIQNSQRYNVRATLIPNGSTVGKAPQGLDMPGGKDSGLRHISVTATRTRPSLDVDEYVKKETRGPGGNSS